MVKVAKKIGVHTLEVDYSQLTGIAKIKLDDEELLYKFLIRPFGRDHIETVSVGRRMFRVKFGGYMTYSVTIKEVLSPSEETPEIPKAQVKPPLPEAHREKATIKEQKERLGKINALLDKLDERLAQGEITEARYRELAEQYKAEAESLRNTVTEKELMEEVGLKAGEKEEGGYREEEPEKQVSEGRSTKYCQNCGTLIDEYSEFCPECGVRVSMPKVEVYSTEKKSAALSVLLSFIIPGVGQIYCGKGMRGLGILVLSILLFLMFGSATSGNPNSDEPAFLFILMILIWIWNIYDAYSLAGKINRGET